MTKILFVCHGNICRSPMAEFVMKELVRRAGREADFLIESAATSREEIGNDIHYGTRAKLREMGIPFTRRAARQITNADYDKYDYLDYKCPKRGEITELIVTSKTRSNGVGQLLMKQMEDYFESVGCEYILVDVFAYNKNGIKFYDKQGYHPRMITDIKKI